MVWPCGLFLPQTPDYPQTLFAPDDGLVVDLQTMEVYINVLRLPPGNMKTIIIRLIIIHTPKDSH